MAMDEDEESRQFLTDVASFNEGLFIRRIFILSDSPRLWPKKDINLQVGTIKECRKLLVDTSLKKSKLALISYACSGSWA